MWQRFMQGGFAAILLLGMAVMPASAQQEQGEQSEQPEQPEQQVQPEQSGGQDVVDEQFEDWAVRCPSGGDGRCEMTQLVNNPETGNPMLRVVMLYPEQMDSAAMVFLLPLGTRLPPGVQLTVDGGEPHNFPFQVCLQRGCRADFRLEDPVRQRMRAGQVATVSMIGPQGGRIDLDISLQGFTDADDRIQP